MTTLQNSGPTPVLEAPGEDTGELACVECGKRVGKLTVTLLWTRSVMAAHRQYVETVCSFDCFSALFSRLHEYEYYCHLCFQHFTRRSTDFTDERERNASLQMYCSIRCVDAVTNAVCGVEQIGECVQCKHAIDQERIKACFSMGCGRRHWVCGEQCLATVLKTGEELGLPQAVCPACGKEIQEKVLTLWGYRFPQPPATATVERPGKQSVFTGFNPPKVAAEPRVEVPVPPASPSPVSAPKVPPSEVPRSAAFSESVFDGNAKCVECGAEKPEVLMDCIHSLCRGCRGKLQESTDIVFCKACNTKRLALD